MNRITLCDYIAHQNPQGAMGVLDRSGLTYERPHSKSDIANLLKQYLAQGGEAALQELARIHPDQELLSTQSYSNFSGAIEDLLDKPKGNTLNASGGGCGCGAYSSFACQGCGMLSANGRGCGCDYNCPCRRCQNDTINFKGRHGSWTRGYDHFNADGGEKLSITNVLLGIGVIAIVYHVIKNNK